MKVVVSHKASLNLTWFRGWFHLVPTRCQNVGLVAREQVLPTFWLGSGVGSWVGSTWFRIVFHSPRCTDTYVLQAFWLGSGLVPIGSDWVLASSSARIHASMLGLWRGSQQACRLTTAATVSYAVSRHWKPSGQTVSSSGLTT